VKSALSAFVGAIVALVAIASLQARTAASPVTAAYTPASNLTVPTPGYPAAPGSFAPGLLEVQRPRVVPATYEVPAPAPRRALRREPTSRRNWPRTALVIGGSAGAGAGIGGLAGGKKGALIGAAIGGGAATLFEALKK
jgi:hypothetical protein